MRIAYGIIGEDLTVNNITDYIENRKLLLNSPGGSLFEGWAIHDFLKGKVDEIGVVGVCASAATIILLAAPHRWGTSNSRYNIHNPYITSQGDAKSMEQTALDLRIEQDILVKRYTEMTGVNSERIQEIMDKNIFLTPEEALNINLINTIKPQIMDTAITEKLNAFEKTLKAIKNFFIKCLILQDVTGKELDFGDKITDPAMIVPGVDATVDGAPCEGKYVMPDGKIMVFVNGKLTEILEPEMTEDLKNAVAENEALKVENKSLQDKILALENEKKSIEAEAKSKIENISNDFLNFKNSFSKGNVDANTPPAKDPKKRVSILL